MTQIISSLAEVALNYDVLFCDLWGCLHNGVEAYPAAVAALRDFRAGGGRVVLLTNAPRPWRYVVDQLDRMAVPRDAWDVVVSSGDAAQDAMFAGAVGRKVWAVMMAKDEGFFSDIPPEWQDAEPIQRVALDEAEGIVCTGLFDEVNETPEDYRAPLMLARERGLKLLCANPDVVVDLGETRLYCAGALAEFYESLGGTSLYFGKPHPPIYDLARRRLGLGDDARILAVGDGIATDIPGAAGEGIDALFVTGGLAFDQFGDDVENPLQEKLDEWLAMRGHAPRYSIGRLR
ncbi:TIGR01459 family HAD-type hydrolase [Paracoccus yeei]|uniref:TIGR01459 family HAD-type hydrolase n=1 Tax=Paracoccus yeei TaxID=147645 RepID=A0A1V0GNQ2_9RHOB|nr:TIGR01459 family HAD-type hydrolase [Paracoccus yeei]ARC35428.1 TIGR01459 family HAD-type hydrolase [Paracoccus yeei]AYF00954.1 TIGR01459 family HAD-type hydrolase [Paracoccus yeei]MBY0137886.1 TIGR01459 family HAD-type hydrolase [Paracoccus yeei]OWJ89939.1 TIGR01459 family HAD-type hydrolase [Paracoccus yeei]